MGRLRSVDCRCEENMVWTTEAAGSHLLLYQDPHELRKRRNRLAQRKHRQKNLQRASANNGRQSSPERTSAGYSSCQSELTSTGEIWDLESGQDNFPAFDGGGGIVSPMDISLPNFSKSIKEPCRGSSESDEYVTRMWQPSFQAFGPAYLSELGLEAYGAALPQCDTISSYNSQEQQAARLHSSVTQTLFEPLLLNNNANHLPQLLPGTTVASDVSVKYIVPRNTNLRAADDSNNFESRDTDGIFETEKKMVLSASHSAIFEGEDLETKFETVIRAVEKAGFESIEDMMIHYYTAIFKEDSMPYWIQSRSRSRSLPAFLASLHESTKDWTDRDAQCYRQQIMHSAESVHLNELISASEKIAQDGEKRNSSEQSASTIFESLWKAIADLEKSPYIKSKKTSIRARVSFIFPSKLSTTVAN